MRHKLWAVLFTLAAPLIFAANAFAGNPPQNAYGGNAGAVTNTLHNTQSAAASTLPFTGISVGQLLLVATALIAAGLLIRWRLAVR